MRAPGECGGEGSGRLGLPKRHRFHRAYITIKLIRRELASRCRRRGPRLSPREEKGEARRRRAGRGRWKERERERWCRLATCSCFLLVLPCVLRLATAIPSSSQHLLPTDHKLGAALFHFASVASAEQTLPLASPPHRHSGPTPPLLPL